MSTFGCSIHFFRPFSVHTSLFLRSSSYDAPYLPHHITIESPQNVHRNDGHSMDIRWRFDGHSTKEHRKNIGVS